MAKKLNSESRRSLKIQVAVTPAQQEAWLDYADSHGFGERLPDLIRQTIDTHVGFRQPAMRINGSAGQTEAGSDSPF